MWYSFDRPQKDERLSRPWSHSMVLNMGPLDWESSALTTKPYRIKWRKHKIILTFLILDFRLLRKVTKTAEMEQYRSLQPGILLKKRLQHSCFLVKFARFLRTPFVRNTFEWLLPAIFENKFFAMLSKIFSGKKRKHKTLDIKKILTCNTPQQFRILQGKHVHFRDY